MYSTRVGSRPVEFEDREVDSLWLELVHVATGAPPTAAAHAVSKHLNYCLCSNSYFELL